MTLLQHIMIKYNIATDRRRYPHNIFLISRWSGALLISTHNICFSWEIRKISAVFGWKKCPLCCYGYNNVWLAAAPYLHAIKDYFAVVCDKHKTSIACGKKKLAQDKILICCILLLAHNNVWLSAEKYQTMIKKNYLTYGLRQGILAHNSRLACYSLWLADSNYGLQQGSISTR